MIGVHQRTVGSAIAIDRDLALLGDTVHFVS
jgi:hypothetical protein